MGRYDNEIRFLASHENTRESRMNRRTPLTVEEAAALRRKHPGIPDDYIDYLTEIGWGPFRECQYMVYGGLVDPSNIFGADTAASFPKRILCFGDNFSGDPAGFLPEDNWKVVEIWHDSLNIYDPQQSFAEFIRTKMLIDEDGNDQRTG